MSIEFTAEHGIEYVRADLLSTARAEARREALEESLSAVRALGYPVGAGDGNTRVIGTSADAEMVIRSLIEKEGGK